MLRSKPSAPVSVILIRENAEQLTGSGCCGKLEGDTAAAGGRDVFSHTRRHQRDLGVLHRVAREFFPPVEGRDQVDVVTVDPRNQLYLIAKLWRDVWQYRPGFGSGLCSLLQIYSLPAVIINGRVVTRRDSDLDPDKFCHLIREALP